MTAIWKCVLFAEMCSALHLALNSAIVRRIRYKRLLVHRAVAAYSTVSRSSGASTGSGVAAVSPSVIVLPASVNLTRHTFAFVAVGSAVLFISTLFTPTLASVTIVLSIAVLHARITVVGAARAVAVSAVTPVSVAPVAVVVTVAITTITLAVIVVAATAWRSYGAATGRAIAAVATVTTTRRSTTGIEAPAGRWGSASPLWFHMHQQQQNL